MLAHEISHVVQKHHLHALQSELRTSAMAESRQLGCGKPGGRRGFRFRAGPQGRKERSTREGLDKDDEYEADRMGVVIAPAPAIRPMASWACCRRSAPSRTSKGLALMMKTHPNPTRPHRCGSTRRWARSSTNMTPVADDLPSFVALRSPSSGATAKPAVAK